MAVKITTNPTNGGTAGVSAGRMTVQVSIDAAATVSTWTLPEGATSPITPGQGPPLPVINQLTPYTFTATAGQRYSVTVQANNSEAIVTVQLTVTAVAFGPAPVGPAQEE